MALRLLTVHAHPDDETITMGGLLATLADRGVETSLICCTDGKLATIFAADMPEEATRPRLAEIRVDELRAAAAILGIGEVTFLGYGDSGMAGADTNDLPNAFWRTSLDDVVTKLVGHIRRIKPHVVVTYDANGGYGHPDHIQAHRATLLAVEAARTKILPDAGTPWTVSKLYYPVFAVSSAQRFIDTLVAEGHPAPFGQTDASKLPFALDDAWITTAVNCRDGVLRKRAAMRAHHSQINDEFPLVAMSEAAALADFSDEYFHLAMTRIPVSLPETDLFAGIDDKAS